MHLTKNGEVKEGKQEGRRKGRREEIKEEGEKDRGKKKVRTLSPQKMVRFPIINSTKPLPQFTVGNDTA